MFEKMRDMIAAQTGIPTEEIKPTSSFSEDLHIDSLDLFEMVMSLEEEFGVEIPNEDLEGINTVENLLRYVEEHS